MIFLSSLPYTKQNMFFLAHQLTNSIQRWWLHSFDISSGVLPALFSMLAKSGLVRSKSFMHSVLFSSAQICKAVLPSRVFLSKLPLSIKNFKLKCFSSSSHASDWTFTLPLSPETTVLPVPCPIHFETTAVRSYVKQIYPLMIVVFYI